MQYNNSSEQDFLNRTIIKAAQILLLVLSPGFFSSFYRAVFVDGAFVVVAVQTCLYLLLILVSIPKTPIDYKSRVISVASIIIIIGLGGLVRNQNLLTGFVYIWFGFIFLSVILKGATRYVLPTVGYISVFIYAVSAGIETIDVGLSRFLAFVGVSWGAIYFLSSILNRTASQRDEFAGLVEELSDTQAKLNASLLENQLRQTQIDQVALQANIAFFKFDFETGLLHPDLAMAKRYGRDDLEPFSFEEHRDQFASEDIQVMLDLIALGSQQSEGWSTEFTHRQHTASGEWITVKVVGINVLQDSKVIFMGASIDITAEVRATEALNRKQEQLMFLAEGGDIGLFEHFLDENKVFVSRQILLRMGVDVDEQTVPVELFFESVPVESRASYISEAEKVAQLNVGDSFTFTHPQVHVDGTKRWIKVTGFIAERDGRKLAIGSAVDVSAELGALAKANELSAQLELVSTAGGVGLIEFSPDTRTFKCNPEVSKRLGVEHSESERDIELFYAHQTEEIRAQFLTPGKALAESQNGELQSFVHPFYLANGDLHYMRVSRVKRDVNGRTSFLGLSLDITNEVQAKEQAEKQSAQLSLLAVGGDVAYFEVDIQGGLVDGNSVLKHRLGLPANAGAFAIERLVDSIPVEAREEFQTNVHNAHEAGVGAVTVFEHPQYKQDGELIYVRVTGTIILRHGRKYVQGASVEITEAIVAKKLAEQQAAQLQQASTKLMQEHDRQAQMYAVIGHELRTPTASLKMILDDAQHGNGHINTALFSSTIDQLLGVIDTLRTVAQPEKMSQASVNSVVLADLLNDQLQILTPIAKQSGVTLKGGFDSLTSDRIDLKAQLLKQLVSNLTKNAIIHSKGSEVRIEAEAIVNDGVKSVTLVVADNGVGIPAAQIENLFSAFSRGSSDAEGTGLGLYVCREIATALGGSLTYEPGLEDGSRFVLRFDAKLSKLASDTDTDTDTDTEALRGLTVLLAEDNPTIQMLTKRMLEQKGAHPVVANNGEEALLKAKEQSFDLILSDIFMPKMNGYQFVEGLRQQGIDTPVIGLTAATIGEETDKMLAAGANAVLSKPVNIQELTKLVASFKG